MIKLCEVLAFNKTTHIVVAKYGEMQIQFVTSKDSLGSTAYIKIDGNNYEIVEQSEYEKSFKLKKKAKNIEDEVSNDSEIVSENSGLI